MNIFKSHLKSNNIEKAIKETDNNGGTVLHYLCDIGDEDCILQVMSVVRDMMKPREIKSYINKQDNNGNTALHVASKSGNNIIASMLEMYGANPRIENNKHEIISVKLDSESDDHIKCGDEAKMKKLIKRLSKATETDSYSVENLDDIVLTEEDKGNIVTNFFKNAMKKQVGGDADTDELLDRLSNNLMTGGGRKKKEEKEKEKEKKDTNTKLSASDRNADTKLSASDRNADTKLSASDIHKQVIDMIRDLGYSDDESKVIKAGLYNYVKTEHPDLGSKARAEKMKDYVTKKHIASIDIMALKQAIEIHYQNKSKK